MSGIELGWMRISSTAHIITVLLHDLHSAASYFGPSANHTNPRTSLRPDPKQLIATILLTCLFSNLIPVAIMEHAADQYSKRPLYGI